MRKIIVVITISGSVLFILIFFITFSVLPKSITNFSMSNKKALKENDNLDIVKPREMSGEVYFNPSKDDIIKYLKEGKFDRSYNLYLIELNKKYSYIISPLFFIVFAFALSGILKINKKNGFLIIIFSCFLYYFLLILCQKFALLHRWKFGFLVMWLPNILILPITSIMYRIKGKFQHCGLK